MKLFLKIALGIFALSPALFYIGLLPFEKIHPEHTLLSFVLEGLMLAFLFTVPAILFLVKAYKLHLKGLPKGKLIISLIGRALYFVFIFNALAVLLATFAIPPGPSEGWLTVLVFMYSLGNLAASIPIAIVVGLFSSLLYKKQARNQRG